MKFNHEAFTFCHAPIMAGRISFSWQKESQPIKIPFSVYAVNLSIRAELRAGSVHCTLPVYDIVADCGSRRGSARARRTIWGTTTTTSTRGKTLRMRRAIDRLCRRRRRRRGGGGSRGTLNGSNQSASQPVWRNTQSEPQKGVEVLFRRD